MKTRRIVGHRGCQALNRAGEPCRAVARTGTRHCFAHSGRANMAELGSKGGRQRAANELEHLHLRRLARNDILVDEAEGIIWRIFKMDGPRAPRGLQVRIALHLLAERARLDEERRRTPTRR
jgi:hypothetical protein